VRRHLVASLMVMVCLSASACGISHAALPAPLPSPSGAWTIRLTQSGGFAGVLLTIQITSDGKLEAQDHRSGRSVARELTPETVAQLGTLVSQLRIAGGTPPPSACADCFLYDLELESATGTTRVHADDTSMADSGAAAVIGFLRQLGDNALAGRP
jgi:hypothetical protein